MHRVFWVRSIRFYKILVNVDSIEFWKFMIRNRVAFLTFESLFLFKKNKTEEDRVFALFRRVDGFRVTFHFIKN